MSSRTRRHPARRCGRWAPAGTTGVALGAIAIAVAVLAATAASAAPSNFGSAVGKVAAVSGTSMEVQGASGQTTVSWTGTTTFTKIVSETVTSINSTDCLTVTGTKAKKSKTTIAARSITITPVPSSGSCTALGPRRLFPGGGFQSAGKGGRGNGPSFRGGGGPGRTFLANLTIASGRVTSVSDGNISLTGIVLSGLSPAKSFSKSSKSTKPTAPETEKLKITTSKSTTLSETQSTTSSALAVGDCVSALGSTASNGAVTASRVNVTSTAGSSCTGGPGGFPGGGGRGGAFFGGDGGPTVSNG